MQLRGTEYCLELVAVEPCKLRARGLFKDEINFKAQHKGEEATELCSTPSEVFVNMCEDAAQAEAVMEHHRFCQVLASCISWESRMI